MPRYVLGVGLLRRNIEHNRADSTASRIHAMRLLNVSQRKYRLDGHPDTVLCKPPEEQRQIRSEVFGAPA
jgi:hypothetical protein